MLQQLNFATDEFLRGLDSAERHLLHEVQQSWQMTPDTFVKRIDPWFSNFRAEDKRLALKVLKNIDYYSEPRFLELLRVRKRQLDLVLHRCGAQLGDVLVIQPPGAADSAHMHAYRLTKEWGIARSQVIGADELDDESASGRVLVAFNDTHGSGNQFLTEVWSFLSKRGGEAKQTVIMAAVVAKSALEQLGSTGAILVPDSPSPSLNDIDAFTADDADRIRTLGLEVYPKKPLGYGDAGLLVAYHFNCPNNTLPIIWASEANRTQRGRDASPWVPLFEYKPKTRPPCGTSDEGGVARKSPNDSDKPVTVAHSFVRADTLEESEQLLRDARVERNRETALRSLTRALQLAAAHREQPDRAAALIAFVERELAEEASSPKERTDHWRRAFDSAAKVRGAEAMLRVCEVVSDYIRDPTTDAAERERLRIAGSWGSKCERIARDEESLRPEALRNRSMFLRRQAGLNPNAKRSRTLLSEAQRAVSAMGPAVDEPANQLEQACVKWARARVHQHDRGYADLCREAEDAFRAAAVVLPARYALARFLRMTYRPLCACEAYENLLSDLAPPPRAFLRDLHIYGEAASQLAMNGWPEAVVVHHLTKAEHGLELATSAGIRDARTVIALAYVRRFLRKDDAADRGLRAIAGLVADGDWIGIAEIAADRLTHGEDLPAMGLSLGMDSGHAWASLGTYVRLFLRNERAARKFFEVALQLDPGNVVSRTNRARAYMTDGDLKAAQRDVSMAAQYADRRFIWWRAVQEEIDARAGRTVPRPEDGRAQKPAPQAQVVRHFRDVRDILRRTANAAPQEREATLRWAFDALVDLTPALRSTGSSRFQLRGYVGEVLHSHTTEGGSGILLEVRGSGPDTLRASLVEIPGEELVSVAEQRVLLDALLLRRLLEPGPALAPPKAVS